MNIEDLKELYSHHSNIVILTDKNFNSVWANTENLPEFLCPRNLAPVFNEYEYEDIESGTYSLYQEGKIFLYELVNLDTSGNIKYVINISRRDIIKIALTDPIFSEAFTDIVYNCKKSVNVLSGHFSDYSGITDFYEMQDTKSASFRLSHYIHIIAEIKRCFRQVTPAEYVDAEEFIENICRKFSGTDEKGLFSATININQNVFIMTAAERLANSLLCIYAMASSEFIYPVRMTADLQPENSVLHIEFDGMSVSPYLKSPVAKYGFEDKKETVFFSFYEYLIRQYTEVYGGYFHKIENAYNKEKADYYLEIPVEADYDIAAEPLYEDCFDTQFMADFGF